MRIVDVNRVYKDRWILAGTVISSDPTWYFDRWRLFNPKWYTRVAVFSITEADGNAELLPNGHTLIKAKPIKYGKRQFSSVNSFEHDFTFDLSGNDPLEPVAIAISGIPQGAEFQQIYASPTGYSATRNNNAALSSWDFSVVNPATFVGNSATSIIMRNQATSFGNFFLWSDNTRTPALYAKTLWFNDSTLRTDDLDKLLIWTDAGGVVDGNMNYNNQQFGAAPSFESRAAYENLIAKGWTITGTAPPVSGSI